MCFFPVFSLRRRDVDVAMGESHFCVWGNWIHLSIYMVAHVHVTYVFRIRDLSHHHKVRVGQIRNLLEGKKDVFTLENSRVI